MMKVLFGVSIFVAMLSTGCSFDKAKAPKFTLNIKDEQVPLTSALLSLSGGFGVMTSPTASADFNCFYVNVTGPGVGVNSRGAGCNSVTNFQGRGIGVGPPGPAIRGVPIELDIPAGQSRVIDVYGIFPSVSECGGANSTGPAAGYFLGTKTANLTQTTSVTVGISYNGGVKDFTCTDNSHSFNLSFLFPVGGSSTGGYPIKVSGNGFVAGATVSINGVNCPVTSQSASLIQCTAPAVGVGTYPLVVTNGDGRQDNYPNFQVVSPGAGFISIDQNSNIDFGNVTSGGGSKDITFTLMNSGGTSSSVLTNPSTPTYFGWKGGTFPGTGGSCPNGGPLTSGGTTCTAVITFTPLALGIQSGASGNLTSAPSFAVNLSGTGI